MTITDQLRVIIEAEVERAVRDMEKWDSSVKNTEKKLDDLEKAANKMSNKLMLVSGGFIAAGGAGLKFSADIETQKIALEVLTGSAETATQVFDELQQFAAKTPLSMGDLNSAATQLLNFGTGVKDVTKTLKTLGDVSMGNAGKLDTVVRAYGRMQMKGKATMEELNMLTEAGVPILDQLAKGMNVATDEIFKMAASGQVSFSDVEQALAALTGEGGKFNNMLERQSASLSGKLSTALDNLKISAAKVMETVVPMAKDLLDTVTRLAEDFQKLDENTRKTIVSLMAVGAAAGPISKVATASMGLVKGIMGLASMNPVVVGIMAVVAAVSLLAGAFLQAKLNQRSFEDGLAAFKASQKEALEAAKSFDEMRSTLPALTRAMYDAAKATGKFEDAISEASRLQRFKDELAKLEQDVAGKSELMKTSFGSLVSVLNEPINASSKGWWDGPATAADKLKKVQDALDGLDGNLKRVVRESAEFKTLFDARNFTGMAAFISSLDGAEPKVKARIEELKKLIETIGSGATISPNVVLPPAAPAKKAWQDWWAEITGVDRDLIANGAQAAKLYLAGMDSELQNAEMVGLALGEKIDPMPYLEKNRDAIRKTLIELYSIDPNDINSRFEFFPADAGNGAVKIDDSIRGLIERYHELTASITEAEAARIKLAESEELSKRAADLIKSVETPLERYQARLAEIDEIWQKQAYEGQLLNEEQLLRLVSTAADEYRASLERVAAEKESIRALSFEEYLENLTYQWWKNAGAGDEAAASLARVGTALAMATLEATIDGVRELGEAWADGTVSAEEWASIMGNIAKQILDMLPMLFIQAGLQLIAQGQWALGLGFITGGIASSIISGLVQGVTANAKGNVFDSGAIKPFAQGGMFTNGVVSRATRFNIGEMGEKGPEAIMPLTRLSDGSLGVAASGGGESSPSLTYVNVQNYTGAKVTTKERSFDGIREIELVVGSIVDRNLSEGRHDGALGGRYQIPRRGVRG